MLFVIHAKDKPGALPTRLANYDAHRAFLSDTSPHGVRIVMSGPLVADDETTMIGSLLVVDAPTAPRSKGSIRLIRSTRRESGRT